MSSCVRVGGLAALWWTACATAPPPPTAVAGPPPEDAAQYYPLQPGWKWAYDVEKAGEQILAVYAVIERSGTTATLQAGDERIQYDVLPTGVSRHEASKDDPPGDFILKSPMRVQATWQLATGTATVTAVGRTVTVPAGTFENCVVIEENRNDPPRLSRTTYAPGVGPIAIEYLVHDASNGRFRTAMRAGLRGVTRPGEDPLR